MHTLVHIYIDAASIFRALLKEVCTKFWKIDFKIFLYVLLHRVSPQENSNSAQPYILAWSIYKMMNYTSTTYSFREKCEIKVWHHIWCKKKIIRSMNTGIRICLCRKMFKTSTTHIEACTLAPWNGWLHTLQHRGVHKSTRCMNMSN